MWSAGVLLSVLPAPHLSTSRHAARSQVLNGLLALNLDVTGNTSLAKLNVADLAEVKLLNVQDDAQLAKVNVSGLALMNALNVGGDTSLARVTVGDLADVKLLNVQEASNLGKASPDSLPCCACLQLLPSCGL